MSNRRVGVVRALSPVVLAASCSMSLAQLSVVSTTPPRNANAAPRAGAISVTFDRPVDPATFTGTSFFAFGKSTGPIAGALSFTNANQTVTLTPSRPFIAGEMVMVVMSNQLRGADGTFMRSAGHGFEFTAGATHSPRVFRERAVISNRVGGSSGPQTRIYGGVAVDFNRDGAPDIGTINEVSSDLRVFLNRNDGSGLFLPMVQPFTPIPLESSPNDVADFDGDGFVDIVTSSAAQAKIAVAFGNGDGTFRTPVLNINTGVYPRGFGVIDVNGDGRLDITVTNAQSNTVSIIVNTGNGTFAAPVNMNVSGNPYGMTAADMNEDGIFDLVIGCSGDRTIKVLRGNGNATFTQVYTADIGGMNWVVTANDVNGDGHMDVSAANSFSSNGSIILGNGDGTLQPRVVTSTGGHTVSTDLADLDGDGDIDWILSSFGAGLWYVYLNNGAGVFSPLTQVVAPDNPSCAIPMDLENDGDIDMVLTDEIADVLVLMAAVCPGDFNADNATTVQDIFDYLAAYFSGDGSADFNGAGGLTVQDIFDFLGAWFSAC